MANTSVISPRISEKSYQLAADGVYVFTLDSQLSKSEIKLLIEKQFSVTVVKINTTNIKGKPKSSAQRRRPPIDGRRNDFKKAYVTLKEGDEIKIFEDVS